MSAEAGEQSSLRPSRRTLLLGALLGLAGLSGGYLASRLASGSAQEAAQIPGLLWPNPKRVGPFALDGTDGAAVDLARLEGRWSFLFFGFTSCPDVCPSALSTMKAAMRRIRESVPASTVQAVFVSVDPERDTLDTMKRYVEFFDPSFIGATAPLERLEGLTRQLGVLHVRGEPDESGNYEVDHSASILLVDPRARLVGIFGAPHDADDIALRFEAIRSFLEQRG